MTTNQSLLPTSQLSRPLSALAPIVAILLAAFLLLTQCGGGDSPKSTGATVADTQPAAEAPAQHVLPPPKNVPLKPPPSDACVEEKIDGKTVKFCGKPLGFASIIVDYGYRKTDMPRRAWVIAVATAIQESWLKNQASNKYKVTEQFPFDKIGGDHDSVGLFQQRPDSGWGKPEELMDPHIAAQKFYGALKDKTKGWKDWENAPLTDVAQRVQRSAYPKAYQKHEAMANKIVDFVLRYPYHGDDGTKATKNDWFVMFQCKDPKARSCRAIPWELIKPVAMNKAAFLKAFPNPPDGKVGDLGNAPHQNDDPQDHTSGGPSCFGDKCNVLGWVYAQDFGKFDGFDLNDFVRWLLDELRAHPSKYQELKYVISTIPSNKGTKYYGTMHAKNGWEPTSRDADHPDHVHLSYKPGFERAESKIMADYLAARGKA